jgi:hypothetical protein
VASLYLHKRICKGEVGLPLDAKRGILILAVTHD